MSLSLSSLGLDLRNRRAAGAALTAPLFTTSFLGASSLPAQFTLTRASAGTYFNTSGVLSTAAINAARFDNSWNGAAWVPAGLLIEEARTNKVCSTNSLLNNSTGANATAAASLTGGGSDGSLLTQPAGTGTGARYDSIGSTAYGAATQIVESVFVRGSGYQQLAFRECSSFGAGASFNLSSLATVAIPIGGATSSNRVITPLGGTWFRVSTLFAFPAATITYGITPLDGNYSSGGDPTSYVGSYNGTSGVIIYGPMYEVVTSPFVLPSSYILTAGAAATRSLDNLVIGSGLPLQLANGPSVWEFTSQLTGVTSRVAFAAGAFDFRVNNWYRSMAVYPPGTDTSPYMTVGGTYG